MCVILRLQRSWINFPTIFFALGHILYTLGSAGQVYEVEDPKSFPGSSYVNNNIKFVLFWGHKGSQSNSPPNILL